MAEACTQLPNRTARLLARRTATSLAGIVALPAKSSVELASSRVEQSSHAYEARIAELEAELLALREQDIRACLILDSATDYAIITMDANGCVTSWNAGAQNIMGYAEAEVLGRLGDVVFTFEDRASGRFTAELHRAIETGRASNERWHLRRDGTRFWASGLMMPLLDADGHPQGFLNILRDCTEVQAAVERRELLMAEMNHRIKNTFATVQAVAAQTRRHAGTVAEFQAAFDARLMVLARSNDVLIRADWHDAPLRDVIEGALDAYGGEPGRITVEGPSVLLAASLAVTVSLAVHELATNAVKYGALSVPAGRVDVSWTTTTPTWKCAASKVDIVWRERGGPAVGPPQRRGFGSQLLERGHAVWWNGQTGFPAWRLGVPHLLAAERPNQSGGIAMNIRDCMSSDVRTTSPEQTIRGVARMKDADTGALPVGENDHLVGMVTDRDIAIRAVAEGKGVETPIREVMAEDIEYCFDDEDVDNVALKMGDLKVRRLPMLNRDKRLVGRISLGEISKVGDGSQGAAALSGVSQPGGSHKHA